MRLCHAGSKKQGRPAEAVAGEVPNGNTSSPESFPGADDEYQLACSVPVVDAAEEYQFIYAILVFDPFDALIQTDTTDGLSVLAYCMVNRTTYYTDPQEEAG